MPIINDKTSSDRVKGSGHELEGIEFHFHSRFIPIYSEPEFRKMTLFNLDPERDVKLRRHYKSYPLAQTVKLEPSFESLNSAKLIDVLRQRKSVREYSAQPVKFVELSNLLLLAYGSQPNATDRWPARTAPSAGGRMPIEIYPVVLNVAGLASGVYHYNIDKECLEILQLRERNLILAEIRRVGLGNGVQIETAGVILVMTAVFQRTVGKYGLRGWRFIYEDAGHIGQNIGLVSTALGLGATAYGGGFDAEVAELLRLDEREEGLVLSYFVGSL